MARTTTAPSATEFAIITTYKPNETSIFNMSCKSKVVVQNAALPVTTHRSQPMFRASAQAEKKKEGSVGKERSTYKNTVLTRTQYLQEHSTYKNALLARAWY
jgi:hypothetical protein